jgi:hypothetical protein
MQRKQVQSPTHNDAANVPRGWSKRKMAATLLKVEALILIALAAVEVVATFTHDQIQEPLAIIGVIAFALMGAGGLLLSARGFTTGKMYGRAPAVLANLIGLLPTQCRPLARRSPPCALGASNALFCTFGAACVANLFPDVAYLTPLRISVVNGSR